MANLVQHFTFAVVLLSLTTGYWNGVEGETCSTAIDYASCEKDRPDTCVNICRSGLYFPPYLLIRNVCEPRILHGHTLYKCKCLWECDQASAAAATAAGVPTSLLRHPIAQ